MNTKIKVSKEDIYDIICKLDATHKQTRPDQTAMFFEVTVTECYINEMAFTMVLMLTDLPEYLLRYDIPLFRFATKNLVKEFGYSEGKHFIAELIADEDESVFVNKIFSLDGTLKDSNEKM